MLIWMCPGCRDHHGVPVVSNVPGRPWWWNGSLEKPTLNPSVLVNLGQAHPGLPVCHGWLKDGQIVYCGDCSHEMRGQTVAMPTMREDRD
jgi:hypothetical protein